MRKVVSARMYESHGGLTSDFYIVSLSCRTVIYKGMFLSYQLGAYYSDLSNSLFESAWRLSTSAFRPTPFRRGGWPIPIG